MRSSKLLFNCLLFTGTCVLKAATTMSGRTDVLRAQAQIARRPEGSNLHLASPRRILGSGEQSVTCFEDLLTTVINPGCFTVPGAGNCISQATQYFVQYIFPSLTEPYRINGFGFISNDGQTVFPSGGILILPDQPPGLRFPTNAELTNLQVRDIPSPGDTSVVFVDLRSAGIHVGPGQAIVICLQFPAGGQLVGPNLGVGPGIAANDSIPDQDCDYFTVNTGTNWYQPDPNDPEPLDWGFEVVYEPLGVESRTWAGVKGLFLPISKPIYREP